MEKVLEDLKKGNPQNNALPHWIEGGVNLKIDDSNIEELLSKADSLSPPHVFLQCVERNAAVTLIHSDPPYWSAPGDVSETRPAEGCYIVLIATQKEKGSEGEALLMGQVSKYETDVTVKKKLQEAWDLPVKRTDLYYLKNAVRVSVAKTFLEKQL